MVACQGVKVFRRIQISPNVTVFSPLYSGSSAVLNTKYPKFYLHWGQCLRPRCLFDTEYLLIPISLWSPAAVASTALRDTGDRLRPSCSPYCSIFVKAALHVPNTGTTKDPFTLSLNINLCLRLHQMLTLWLWEH